MKEVEFVGRCKICGKSHYRGEGDLHLEWYYHESVGTVCRHHEGVEEWYQELINKAQKELEEMGAV